MTTSPMEQPGVVAPGPDRPRDEADDEPREPDTRGTIVMVLLLVLLALGVRAFTALVRNGRSDGTSPRRGRAPHSTIRIAAAPHSVVYVVSAPSLGRSHVQIPKRPSGATVEGLERLGG